jgi:hypothetical protein
MQKIGVVPEAAATTSIGEEDAAAQNSMLNASINRQ